MINKELANQSELINDKTSFQNNIYSFCSPSNS